MAWQEAVSGCGDDSLKANVDRDNGATQVATARVNINREEDTFDRRSKMAVKTLRWHGWRRSGRGRYPLGGEGEGNKTLLMTTPDDHLQ